MPITPEGRRAIAALGSRTVARAVGPKIKCIEINPPIKGAWPDLWGSAWNAATVSLQLAAIKALGANCVKVTGGTTTETDGNGTHAYPGEPTYRLRRRFFLRQCRRLGLRVYWTLGNGGGTVVGADGSQRAILMPPLVALAKSLGEEGHGVIVGFDLCNEFNNTINPASTWSTDSVVPNAGVTADMAAFVSAVRAVTHVPLSASVLVTSRSALGRNGFIDLQHDLRLDFHDIHPYYQDAPNPGGYKPNGPVPAAADMAVLEGRAKFLGSYLIGEIGCALTAGASFQAQWFDGIGEIARRDRCRGAVMFILADYETAYRYGIYADTDTSFTNPRSGMSVPFSRWPGY
jgi:hypothetical protein